MKSIVRIGIVIGTLVFVCIGYIYHSFFALENGYNWYEIPFVRSCQTNHDCRGFAVSCVNTDFIPRTQELVSSAFPVWQFDDNIGCECQSYMLIHLCAHK